MILSGRRAKSKMTNKALPFRETEHAATAKVSTETERLKYFLTCQKQKNRKVTIYVTCSSNL